MKKTAIVLTLILLLTTFTGCKANSDEPVSSDFISSEIISSKEVSSEEPSSKPTSSEITADTSVSTEATASKEEEPSSKPVSSKNESKPASSTADSESQLKENSKKINSYVNFSVADSLGNPIAGMETSFGFGIPTQAAEWPNFDSRTKTNDSGETTIQLINFHTQIPLVSVALLWDKPFKATLTTPSDENFSLSSTTVPMGEIIDFSSFTKSNFAVNVKNDQVYNFHVLIEEIAE